MTAVLPVPAALSVRGLGKAYSDRPVLADVSFDVAQGQLTCIVGPSGAGKTTLLRCLAGLLVPSAGEVRVEGVVAPVFQDYSRSLLPWMTVRGNVTLPLRAKRVGAAAREARLGEALAAVGLAGAEDRYPWQLSGGMQQRVAIARALAYGPEALLMDEPFASVDAQTRADLEDLMLSVRDRFGVTIVLVTHDIDEAIYLSDRVIVLSGAPARVVDDLPIALDKPRDQLATKADPRFGALRAHLFGLIRGEAGE
jgi:NitT/TauT family transport system ATP-binding protein